jgi:hypothetical protein
MADADSVMNEPELRYLTNELRKQAVVELSSEIYSVLTRDNIMSLLPPGKTAAECFEGQCLVEVGRNIGADYAVQGTVSRFGVLLTLTVEAYDTKSGKLLGSFTGESQSVEGFLAPMREKAASVFDAILRNDGIVKPVALPVPDTVPAPQSIPTQIPQEDKGSSFSWLPWTLDALGVAGLAFGIYQNSEAGDRLKTYRNLPDNSSQSEFDKKWKDFESAKTMRSIGYAVGGAFLASGIALHFVF